ncbi:MAG: hypothetical protein K2X27_14715, partial [Candidatus Obscuribacterales bacterium]|nr:hypothetical protein [Candidatus Obscuribacterales bacterium]
KQALANAMAVEIQLNKDLNTARESHDSWQKRTQLARTAGNEELAAQAELRAAQWQDAINDLEIKILEQKDFIANFKKDISKIEARRFSGNPGLCEAAKAMDQAGSAFEAIERLEGKVLSSEAMAELSSKEHEKDRKLEELSKNEALENELATLKASIKKKED